MINQKEIRRLHSEESRVAFIRDVGREMLRLEKEKSPLIKEKPDIQEELLSSGVYYRTMFAKKGTLLTGKVHLQEHLSFFMKGRALIVSPEGVREVVAPERWVSKPGTQRVAFFLEDSEWTVVHNTKVDDIEQVENAVVVDDIDEYRRVMNELGHNRGTSSNSTNLPIPARPE